MKPIWIILTLGLLAACGVDGEPEAPKGGFAVSGEANIGVVGRF